MDKSGFGGKTVLVIGADSTFGTDLVEDLSKQGARVIMACQTMFRAEREAFNIVERTATRELVVQYVDLKSWDSIRNFVDRIKTQENRLDIVINYASASMTSLWDGTPEWSDGIEHYGRFILIVMLLDLLKKSTASRVINVSSNDHSKYFGGSTLRSGWETLLSWVSPKPDILDSTSDDSTAVRKHARHTNSVFTEALAQRHGDEIVCMSLEIEKQTFSLSPFVSKNSRSAIIECALMEVVPEKGEPLFLSHCDRKTPDPRGGSDNDATKLLNWIEKLIEDNADTEDMKDSDNEDGTSNSSSADHQCVEEVSDTVTYSVRPSLA